MDTSKSNSATGGPASGSDAPAALGAAGARATRVGTIVAMAGVGAATLLAVTDRDMRPVFLYAYLIAFVYYLSITLGAQFFVLVQHLCRAGWSVTVRRIAEAIAALGHIPARVRTLADVVLPPQTRRAVDAFEHGAGGTLPVGAGNVNGTEPVLGISEQGAEISGVIEPGFICGSPDPLVHGQLREEVMESFLVVHRPVLPK